MSKERKRGLPSDGELTDDKLEISGGAGGDAAAQNAGASVAVGQSSSGASSNIIKGVETGAGGEGWG
jgi:hypothetical protein